MSSKVLAKNSAARLESELLGIDTTEYDHLATHVVNPSQSTIGKVAILNMISWADEDLVLVRNKVISRVPIVSRTNRSYDFQPYPPVEFRIVEHRGHYSNMLLNKWMMLDPDYIITSTDRFLLSIDPIDNGYINCIGYLILKTIKQ